MVGHQHPKSCHRFIVKPLEEHLKSHLTTFRPVEGHCKGHFTTFPPLEGHFRGHFTMICPLEGHTSKRALSWCLFFVFFPPNIRAPVTQASKWATGTWFYRLSAWSGEQWISGCIVCSPLTMSIDHSVSFQFIYVRQVRKVFVLLIMPVEVQ